MSQPHSPLRIRLLRWSVPILAAPLAGCNWVVMNPSGDIALQQRDLILISTALMLLIGNDAVEFNRAFCAVGLDREILRFSSLIEENVLLASGPENTRGLLTSAGYFEDLATASGLDFAAAPAHRFGPDAPVLNSLGESCYEGVRLLTELMRRAGSPEVPAMTAVAEGLAYESPRGTVEVHGRHLRQQVFLAVADGAHTEVVRRVLTGEPVEVCSAAGREALRFLVDRMG